MRHILFSLFLLLSGCALAQDIQPFIRQQMTLYPKSHLLDIYKSCFQDYMGAEYLVSDRERVKVYLDEELNTTGMKSPLQWYYEPCGIKGRYVRVSLRAVMEGLITEDMLLDAFVRSANVNRPSVKSWRRKWHKIIGTIDKMNLNLPDYDREKQFIDSILSVGQYAISHSSDYRETYHPHYRIVERRIFENELKPLIDRGQNLRLIAPIKKDDFQEHSPNVFLIMYDAEVGKESLLKAIKDYQCEIVYDYGIINGMALKKPEDKTLEETMQYFKTVKGVTNVEYDNVIRLTDPVKPRLEIR